MSNVSFIQVRQVAGSDRREQDPDGEFYVFNDATWSPSVGEQLLVRADDKQLLYRIVEVCHNVTAGTPPSHHVSAEIEKIEVK